MNILLISLLGCLVVALPSASAQKVKWCVKTQNELNKCKHLATKSADLECHLEPSTIDCIKSIKKGDVDAVTADGEHIYFGGLKNYELRPIIVEKYEKERCHAVAVVKKDSDFTIKDLKGKTSCHSCYQRSAGWNLPIGSLVADGIIPWQHEDMPIEKAVSQFFLSSCIPGIPKEYQNLCKACQGDCSCSKNEKYSGDEGAFQCLKNGNGQVGFFCHYAIPEPERPNYQLLCMDGTTKSVEDYKTCHFAKERGRAVLARKDADSQQIYKVLKLIPGSDLFSSTTFGGKDLIFSDSAFELMELPKITDSFLCLKEDYFKAMHALKAGNPPAPIPDRTIQWCTISHAEQQKCDSLPIPRLECIRTSSVEECIQKVMRREADAFAADGGQVYIAAKCGLVPAMVEQYDEKSCNDRGEASSYHVVAVVRKDSGLTWSKLRGKKSCHTGLNRNAGWKVPDSAICGNVSGCTLYNFFSEGCAPGADPASNMCKLCKGSGKAVGEESKCKASSAEMYYGYDGAFRCLAEKSGEVAFIKHTIVGDYTDGKGPDWAKSLKSDEYGLICPESPDMIFPYTDFAKCNLAKVPAHAVVTREDVRSDVVTVLNDAQNSKDKEKLFTSEGERNLLFSDSTKCLQEITKTPLEFLSKKYVDMIERTYTTGQGQPDLVKICTLE